jgi:hypothetical protein
MLSVRLPQHVSKSSVVQLALERHLNRGAQPNLAAKSDNPFAALRGVGNREFTTEQLMCMTRGDDWNQP